MNLSSKVFRWLALLFGSALVSIASTVSAQHNIIIVSDAPLNETGYAEWLSGFGHNVTISENGQFHGTLSEQQKSLLESYDLVIVSRNTGSGSFNEPADWNGLDVPILMQNPWMGRNNRWFWQNADEMQGRGAAVMQVGSARFAGEHPNTVPDFDHPVFEMVSINQDGDFPTVTVRSIEVNSDVNLADPGAGQWLLSDIQESSQRAMLIDFTGAIGEEYYPGSGHTIINRRMIFLTGNEYNVGSADEWRSRFTLDGERLLMNVINHAGAFGTPQAEMPFSTDFGSVRFIRVLEQMTREVFEFEPVSEGGSIYVGDDATVTSLPASLAGNLAFKTRNLRPETVLQFAGASPINSRVDTNLATGSLSYPLSFSIWINRFDDGTERNKIFGWFPTGGVPNRGEVEIVGSSNLLRLVWWGGGPVIEVPAPAPNVWAQIGLVITEDDARLYINGNQVGSLDEEPWPLDTGINLWVGGRPDDSEDSFPGWLKEWVVYDGDIGDEGMQQLAAEAGLPDGDLLQYLPLNEGEGDVVFDQSGNGVNGQLFGPYSWESTALDVEAAFGIGFVTDRNLTVYLAVDENMDVPAWIENRYTNSGMKVETTVGDFDLWQRHFGARGQVSLLATPREPGENNYWVILSEGPDAIVGPRDFLFNRASAGTGDWRLDAHNWTLTTDPASEKHQSEMVANFSNFSPEAGFRTSARIRVPSLQDAGDNAIGLSLLGSNGEGLRAEWLPRTQDEGSVLRLVRAATEEILAETDLNGSAQTRVDNNVGVSSGATEIEFSSGVPVFADTAEGIVVFTEAFADGGEGWTTGSNNPAVDQWEIGVPTSGPGSAFSGSNVAATNLAGPYTSGGLNDTIAWLRSPVIDLVEVGEATLSFYEYMDVDTFEVNDEVFHFGVVTALDADTLDVVAEIASYSAEITSWTERVLDLSEVTGRRIVLEFALFTDDEEEFVGDGWYIDAIEIVGTGVEISALPEALALDGSLFGISTERAGVVDESDNHLEFTVVDRGTSGNDGVTVYVAWDVRASGFEPNWLVDHFARTDHFVDVTGQARQHRLWGRVYPDGEVVTLGGASAAGAGPFPEGINNYFVLFGDARRGLESIYTLTAEGELVDGSWEIVVSLRRNANGTVGTVSTVVDDLPGSSEFGVFARHPDSAAGGVTHSPIWQVFDFSMDFLGELPDLPGFEAWREEYFAGQLDNPEISGPEAAPAGDGVSNLVKYALGLSPWDPAAAGDTGTVAVTNEGEVVLIYWRRTDIDDIEYIPEVSDDLIVWRSGSPHVVEALGALDGNLREVEATGSVSGDRGFIRLRVRLIE